MVFIKSHGLILTEKFEFVLNFPNIPPSFDRINFNVVVLFNA